MPVKSEKRRCSRYRITVVIDLDETMIHSHTIPTSGIAKKVAYPCHRMADDFLVCERPGLQSFLDWLFKNFNVIIWSAGSPEYVDFIAKNVIETGKRKTKRVLNSDDCDRCEKRYGQRKNLAYLWDVLDIPGCGPACCVLIDDLAENRDHQSNNSIRIPAFNARENERKDCALKEIADKLTQIDFTYNSPGLAHDFRPCHAIRGMKRSRGAKRSKRSKRSKRKLSRSPPSRSDRGDRSTRSVRSQKSRRSSRSPRSLRTRSSIRSR